MKFVVFKKRGVIVGFGLICLIILVGILFFNENKMEKKVRIVDSYAFDERIFTQGLEINNSNLFFSSGLYESSFIGVYDIEQQQIKEELKLSSEYFAEGLTILKDEIWLLTWRENTVFVYDKDTFEQKRKVSYEGEGWGIASSQDKFYMSNGSNIILIRNQSDFSVIDSISVVDDSGNPLDNLNELEFANNQLYANRWHSNLIYVIDPVTGKVKQTFDCSELVAKEKANGLIDGEEQVLNGIAHLSENLFYVTGKNWSNLYKVEMK